MKKFIKITLVIALICIVAGLIISVAGSVSGGGTDVFEMARNGELNWSIDDLGFGEWGKEERLYHLDDVEVFDDNVEILSGDIEKCQIDGTEAVTKLDITVGGGVLQVSDSGDDNFYLEAENAEKLQVYTEGNELKVKAIKTKEYQDDMEIRLYVPGSVPFEDVSVELGAGQINIADITCKNLEAEVGAGELVVNNTEVTLDADFSVGAGHIQAQVSVLGNLEAECSMGGAEFVLKGQETDFNYEIECAAGQVRVGSEAFQALATEKDIDNGASKNISLNCALGAIEVEFER